MKKKLITIITVILVMMAAAGCGQASVSEMQEDTAGYLIEQIPQPGIGTVGGDWTVIGLARGAAKVPEGYYDSYYRRVCCSVQQKKGILHERRYTEYARVSLALAAIGKDPSDVEGYNLLKPLEDYDAVINQGINGPVFALIAANAADYDLKMESKYLAYILDQELPDGGFSLTADSQYLSPDLTAMVLQALAPYKDDERAAEAVERTAERLASIQLADGSFDGTSETISQVIIGLCAVGIDPTGDGRFIKDGNTLYDALMEYSCGNGSFSHEKDGESELMSTDQALCALDVLELFSQGSSLYEMRQQV